MASTHELQELDEEDRARHFVRRCLSDRNWRLRNLYWIIDKDGNKIRFKPNFTQERVLRRLSASKRNVFLKSRQHGITTLMCILGLDTCLFRSNTTAGIVAHRRLDAESFFLHKVLFAYENLPEWLKAIRPARIDRNGKIEFGNNSSLSVSTSYRGGTLQFLHVSEYGPMCSMYPARAHEVKTGALNALAPGGIGTIESTAMGVGGDFYDKCMAAMQLERQIESGAVQPSELDYRLLFLPWFEDPTNEMDPAGVVMPPETVRYLDDLENELGIRLSERQRAWYAWKAQEQGDDMKREHPSTPEEAFAQSIQGAIYAKELAQADKEGRIIDLPVMPGIPVNTFWDIGHGDATAIWFHQQVGMWHHFVDYYENSLETVDHYVRVLAEKGYIYGTHYLPHDGENTDWSLSGAKTRAQRLEELLGFSATVKTVPRITELKDGIEMVRAAFPLVRFDRTRCGEMSAGCGRGGLLSLRNYRYRWNEKLGVFSDEPLHDWASNGADAFRQWAQGYPMANINDEQTRAAVSRRRRRRGSGMAV